MKNMMKNRVKFLWIIAFAAIVGFAFVTCDNGTTDNGRQTEIVNITVTGVTVAPAAVAVLIGTEQDFTATVQGSNNPPQTVTWSVEGNLHQETTISSAGRLSVHIDENALTFVVRATSTHTASISGTATVTVTDIPPVDPTGYIIPTGLTAALGQTLSDITLPANWTWVNPYASVGTAGQQTHQAVYTRIGNYNPITRSVIVTVTTAWKIVSAGAAHSHAVTTDGQLWSWGTNQHGRTGLNTDIGYTLVPTRLGTASSWAYVSAGVNHSLAVTTDGQLWAWGRNQYGRTGLNTDIGYTLVPTRVGTASNWASVSADAIHSLAITTTGELWAWGLNDRGATGLGTTSGITLVPTRVGTASNWASVSAGALYSFAITTTGELWAWGYNANGRTGLNTTVGNTLVPTRVGAASNWVSVSAGWNHSLAVTTTGELWAWGSNQYGRTGLSSMGNTIVPTRVGTTSNWDSVSAGLYHSLAITTTGELWAWGSNTRGRTGHNTTWGNTVAPARVGTASNWASVSAGWAYGLAVTTTWELWAWGFNYSGRTGLNTTTGYTLVPTRVWN